MQGTKTHNADSHPSSIVDLEKAGAHRGELPALREDTMKRRLADQDQTSQSRHVIIPEKVIVTGLVVFFVLAEVYFVGVSIREWIDNQNHKGNSTSLSVQNQQAWLDLPKLLEIYKAVDGGQDEIDEDQEPYEDFEGGISYKATSELIRLSRPEFLHHKKNSMEKILQEEEEEVEGYTIASP
ncbi:hypothetical protein R1sor_007310 [Riccia sorocarpa]|uniref:Uncharacterized protein n=1 Tax=Riccia sorocarpa TaxID=122646 RepID=A0ABD3HTI6_9MARC